MMDLKISRRSFLKKMIGLGFTLLGLISFPPFKKFKFFSRAFAEENPALSGRGPDLVVAEKGTPEQILKKALNSLGGIGKFVKKGNFVVVKPNAAWARTPQEAANTNPQIVEALVRICYQAGAGRVVVRENPCDNYKFSFSRGGYKRYFKSRCPHKCSRSQGSWRCKTDLKYEEFDGCCPE
jgi:hypothetical protein